MSRDSILHSKLKYYKMLPFFKLNKVSNMCQVSAANIFVCAAIILQILIKTFRNDTIIYIVSAQTSSNMAQLIYINFL